MDSDHSETLYLQRAKSELDLANAVFRISGDISIKTELELKEDATFYSNVIALSYYAIFYAAKAYLTMKGIKTEPPEEHKKTYDEFDKIVQSGEVDVALFIIYKSLAIRADELLGIFMREKAKRGKFTYKKLPQANKEPADESVKNATIFFKNIGLMMQKH
jgi:uncharacterized protein (UPF0332 family)